MTSTVAVPMPSRGDVWLVDLGATRGHEQAGKRPCVIVSVDGFNRTQLRLVVVVPMTTVERGFPTHVTVAPPEGGVRVVSYIKCEDFRSASKDRFIQRLGCVSPATMRAVEDRIKLILGIR
jgi:mRNA interferase MazF